ncbi:hypothetical protein C2S52_008859 [Perilla frutescens var. hirtella]|nr:hypothetical protein C2S52_008859 [Perilla frutescens var. hirtella]
MTLLKRQEALVRTKNKRKWNDEEDAKLVEALLDMVNLGKFKAENGFQPGYLNYAEEKLQVVLPDSGLKAKPHIESRIKTLKRYFHIVYDILNEPNTSGFGMEPIKNVLRQKSLEEQQIDSEIRKMHDLIVEEVIKAVCEIARRDELIDVFFSMTEEGKGKLVKAILNKKV